MGFLSGRGTGRCSRLKTDDEFTLCQDGFDANEVNHVIDLERLPARRDVGKSPLVVETALAA
jgi:hypothetical protein